MRARLWLPIALVALALGLPAFACGGSGDGTDAPDLSQVPTATLPDPLPEPLIIQGAAPAREGTTYTVQPGDSLAAIAEQFDLSPDALARANSLADPTQLEVGQVLVIPAGAAPAGEALGATAVPPPTPEAAAPAEEGTYTVQLNDNASAIAGSFGITLDELAAANGTTVDDLRSLEIGDVLTIPTPSAPPVP